MPAIDCFYINCRHNHKKDMLRLFLLLFIGNSLFGQKNEFDLGTRFSIPTENVQIWQPDAFTRYDIYRMKALNDYGFDLFYKYRVWKKFQLYCTAGLSISRANYSFPLRQTGPREIIDDVKITNNRLILKIFGIEKKFSMYDGKFGVNFGWSVTNHFYFSSKKNYFAEGLKTNNVDLYDYEHITYGYDISLFYNEEKKLNGKTFGQLYWNGEYYIQLQGTLTDKLGVNFTINYTRNTAIAYDYKYFINYKSEDYDYNIISGDLLDDQFFSRKNHFMGLKMGIYYAF
jgi:hypothetical protein